MTLSDEVEAILQQSELAVASAGALQVLDDAFFKAVKARGVKFAPALRDSFVGVMDSAANDPRYVQADQLGFIDAKLRALKALNDSKYKIPKDMLASINARIDSALAAEQNPYRALRSGECIAQYSGGRGRLPKAYDIAKAEIARSGTPYYYEGDLAEIAEKQGHRDEAIALLEKAYQDSQGPATRFQWGAIYMSGLLRMTPKDTRASTAGRCSGARGARRAGSHLPSRARATGKARS